jgi:hypothetical protein
VAVDQAYFHHLVEPSLDLGEQRPAGDRNDNVVGRFPAELLDDLEGQRLGALGVVGADVDVDERPVELTGDLRAQTVDVVVGSLHRDQIRTVDRRGNDLPGLQVGGDEDVRLQPGVSRVSCDRVGEVPGRGTGDGGIAEPLGHRERHRDDAVLEGVGRVGRVVLQPQLPQPELRRETVRSHQRRHPGAEVYPVLAAGQKRGVPPHRPGPGRDRGTRDLGCDPLVVVHDFQRREAELTDVKGFRRVFA